MNLPRLGTPEHFASLREFLVAADYSESSLLCRLQLRSVQELDAIIVRRGFEERVPPSDPLNVLIRLFLLGHYVTVQEIEKHFPDAAWSAIEALGLISDDGKQGGRFAATVALYPVGDKYFISDRWSNADHSPVKSYPDIVYPALTQSTQQFLLFLPDETCDSFLELCAGSGVAAIHASRYAKRAWATDIAHRSTHFASFNAALNDAKNVTVLEGDLFAPVEGLTFDRIAAHPPYMPVLRPAEIYFAGGEDGEQITRRLINELPKYLRPGGRLYCRMLGTDRPGLPFERRVREWLGPAESEFDVALFVIRNVEPRRFALDSAVRKLGGIAEVEEWQTLFTRLEVSDIMTGALVLQRVDEPRQVFTVRRSFGTWQSREAIDWTLRWETAMVGESWVKAFFQMKPRLASQVEIHVIHQLQNGELTPLEFTLKTNHPFTMECRVQHWMCMLLAQSSGSMTVAQLFADSKGKGWIHPNTLPEEFADLLGVFVSGGFLEVEEAKLPAAEG